MLAGEMPEVLFLDIQMPHVNGIQLLEFIRSKAAWNHLPILMLTSESDEERVNRLSAWGGWICFQASVF